MSSQAAENQDLCTRFAEESERRRVRIEQLLRSAGDAPKTLASLRSEVRAWIADAAQLGLPELAAALGSINAVVLTLNDSRDLGGRTAALKEWTARMCEIAAEIAAQPGFRHLSLAIQALRSEVTAQRTAKPAGTAAPAASPVASAERQARRILVCDDSPIIGEMMALELRARGHNVCLTSDPMEFDRQLEAFDPEMVFLDIQMPEMSGDEVCKRLRQQMNPVPVIFISSLPDAELAQLTRAAGADGFLSKQHGMEEICAYLEAMLAQFAF